MDSTQLGSRSAPAASQCGAKNIRMVAIDLDGTLLNDAKQISEQTLCAIRRVQESGVKVVIASARPPRSVRHFHSMLGLDTLQINYNGALIWDDAIGAVHHQPMPGATALQIIGAARDYFDEVIVSCEILDRWYTDRLEQPYTTETGRLFAPDVVAPLETFCNQPVTKLMLLGDPRMILRLEDLLIGRFAMAVAILRCDPELIQIMDQRVSKANALRVVAAHYGIPIEQVLAIGDAANDVEMLEAAGIAVAVGNAHPAVKEIADWVAPSNNEHGVYATLRQYKLCD
jgi:Cof subfamily protein (haloacid dehalogenase superfamily)